MAKTKKRLALLIPALLVAVVLVCGVSSKVEKGSVTTIGVEEFAKVIKQKKVRLIDVRTPKEYAEEHLQGAENIDVKAADFGEKTKEIKGKVAVYCRSGKRSLNAANQLAAQGCTVYDLGGGIVAWKQAGKPTTK
ncbi:MAG: rhodanese-like domain-containing protein [Bacteroidales bacterium]|nr:rhodanese-like domain-containing protein [Bacteroidales bacterium]